MVRYEYLINLLIQDSVTLSVVFVDYSVSQIGSDNFKINKHNLLNPYRIIVYADSIQTRNGSCFRGKTLEHGSIESVIFLFYSKMTGQDVL